MFTQGFFVRMLIAVIVAIALIAVIPPVLRLIGFPASGDLDIIIRVVIAICALFYIFFGKQPA